MTSGQTAAELARALGTNTGATSYHSRVLAEAGRQGLAVVNWDVVPYDWIHDRDIAASRAILMSRVRPGAMSAPANDARAAR